ncbi:MAG: flippase [Thermoproteota archaeon]
MQDDVGISIVSVAKGSVYLTLQSILATMLGVVGYSVLARTITQSEMGVMAGLTLLVTLIQLVSDFGLNSTIAKFISELAGRGEDASEHMASALFFRLILSLSLAIAMFIFSSIVSSMLFETAHYETVISIVVLDAFLASLPPLLSNILLGLGRMRDMAVCGITLSLVRWLSVILLVSGGYGLSGVAWGWVAGDLVGTALYFSSVVKNAGLSIRAKVCIKTLGKLLRFSWPIYISSLINFLYTWYDRILILTFLPLADLGIYNVVYWAFSVPLFIATSLASSLLPYYGMAYGRNDAKTIVDGVRHVSKYSMLVMSPLMLGLTVTARPVITLFAGQQYEPGWTILSILSVFGLIYGLSPAFSSLLLIYGKTHLILLMNVASITLSLVPLPLLSTLGLEGLAVMKGFSFLISLLLSLYFTSRIIRVKIDNGSVTKILFSSTIMAIIVMLAQGFFYNKLLLPLYVLLGGAVYLLMIRLLNILDKEALQVVREVAGEKLSKYLGMVLGFKQDTD